MVSDKGQRVANESVPLALITNFLLLTVGSCTSFDAEAYVQDERYVAGAWMRRSDWFSFAQHLKLGARAYMDVFTASPGKLIPIAASQPIFEGKPHHRQVERQIRALTRWKNSASPRHSHWVFRIQHFIDVHQVKRGDFCCLC